MSRRYSALLSTWSLLAAVLLSGGAWASAVDVTVREDSGQRVVLDYSFETFTRGVVRIEGEPWMTLALGKESLKHRKGDPALPDVSRSVIIPDNARMAVRVIDGDYYEISDVNVAPSKGVILRTQDPASVPHTFGPAYRQTAFWPAELAQLGTPYVMRDQRGIVVTVNPFQYNPATSVLRVYTSMTVEVVTDGVSQVNVPDR